MDSQEYWSERPPYLEYGTVCGTLPRPTDQQIDDFVAYVANAHSWYRDLPLAFPGRPFYFFLDPTAGTSALPHNASNHSPWLRTRLEGEPFFHYNSVPTHTYLRRFGYLEYATADVIGTMLVRNATLGQIDPTPADPHPPIVLYLDELHRAILPESVRVAGTVHWTAVVHDFADEPRSSTWIRSEPLPETWPEESGGKETRDALAEIVRAIRKDWRQDSDTWRARLPDLLRPERKRERREAVRAIGRMLDLVFLSGPS